MKNNYIGNCELFGIFTVATTVIWTIIGRKWSLQRLAWAMFFPGLFAPWFFYINDLSAIIGYHDVSNLNINFDDFIS